MKRIHSRNVITFREQKIFRIKVQRKFTVKNLNNTRKLPIECFYSTTIAIAVKMSYGQRGKINFHALHSRCDTAPVVPVEAPVVALGPTARAVLAPVVAAAVLEALWIQKDI